ncbi:MAG: DUF4249 family protein [Saprospirales bacterium]|nr:MAG: DUF4249 family protein [Saprospirales bacterium]
MIYRLALFFFLATLIACSNDFDLFTERENIPVVFGLLSKAEENQYIRLERAFLDETRSAFLVANEPDSIFYENAIVELIRESTGDRFTLERINAADIGLPREEGVFPSDPNFLYTISSDSLVLSGGEIYRIEVRDINDSLMASSFSPVLRDIDWRSPQSGTSLNLQGISLARFLWAENPEASFYSLRLIFNYLERSPATGNEFEARQATWTMTSRTTNNNFSVRGEEFLQFVRSVVPEDPSAQRRFNSIDLRLDAVGEELANYIDVGRANLGITSSNELPLYTNIDGGLGVFSSTNFELIRGYNLTTRALDSLTMGSTTANLNFIR